MAAIGQVRIMGGAIVLAIATSVFHSYTRPRLQNILGSADITSTHVSAIGTVLREDVREVFAQGYNLQMIVLCAFAGAQILSIFLMWRKKQIII
jgi:hypothetical protein